MLTVAVETATDAAEKKRKRERGKIEKASDSEFHK